MSAKTPMKIDLAAERAASQARQIARDAEHFASLSPWMQYLTGYLFAQYPGNPVTELYCFKTGLHADARGSFIENPSAEERTRLFVETESSERGRIARISAEAETFLHRLPEEHTFTAWLAAQED